MSYIASIGTAVPSYQYHQKDILGFMKHFQNLSADEYRVQAALYAKSGIENRYCAIPDYACSMEERVFYPKNLELKPFPQMNERMALYQSKAPELAISAVEKCVQKHEYKNITHLITVSCTGMAAPGLDIWIIKALGLPTDIHHTSINFMGCYATVHALKQAQQICAQMSEAKVLIVSVELCSLHFQQEKTTDNILSNLLFADGAAAILVTNSTSKSLAKIVGFYSKIDFSGEKYMAWRLSNSGFLMTLSGYVPQLLKANFYQIAEMALKKFNLNFDDITHWAIHPGGKKILDAIMQKLSLSSQCMSASYNVLRQYGNMSSPTIVFVLNDMFENVSLSSGEYVFGAAFGPGLISETFILQTS